MVPAWLDYPGNVTVTAHRGSVELGSLYNLGPDDSIGWDELAYIVVSQDEGTLTQEETWRDALGVTVYGGGVISSHEDGPLLLTIETRAGDVGPSSRRTPRCSCSILRSLGVLLILTR